MNQEQLDRIERKLNYLILVASRHDFHEMFDGNYEGWNALSAYEEIMKLHPDYLNPAASNNRP